MMMQYVEHLDESVADNFGGWLQQRFNDGSGIQRKLEFADAEDIAAYCMEAARENSDMYPDGPQPWEWENSVRESAIAILGVYLPTDSDDKDEFEDIVSELIEWLKGDRDSQEAAA